MSIEEENAELPDRIKAIVGDNPTEISRGTAIKVLQFLAPRLRVQQQMLWIYVGIDNQNNKILNATIANSLVYFGGEYDGYAGENGFFEASKPMKRVGDGGIDIKAIARAGVNFPGSDRWLDNIAGVRSWRPLSVFISDKLHGTVNGSEINAIPLHPREPAELAAGTPHMVEQLKKS